MGAPHRPMVAATTAAALDATCWRAAGRAPLEVYGNLVANAKGAGLQVIADLSSPRIEPVAEGGADLVKLNDWELAEYVKGPVDTPERMLSAAENLQSLGSPNVLVTRVETRRWRCSRTRPGSSPRQISMRARARVAATR